MGDVLGRLRYCGETFIIERNDKPVAILQPYEPTAKRGSLKDVLKAWSDAGAPDEGLAELLDEIGRSDAPVDDPWESS